MRRLILIAVLSLGALQSGCMMPKASGSSKHEHSSAAGFTLSDITGKKIRLSDFQGKVVMLMFWGACCLKSYDSLRSLQEIWDRYRDQGFELISINKDPSDRESEVRQVVRRYRYRFPVLLDQESEVSNRFNPTMVFPFHVLLDKQGRIFTVHEGYNMGDEAFLEKKIKELLSR